MLRALILDFDGVVVDSEPIIMKLTQDMAAQEGWQVSEEEYYRDYLALDDRTIVEYLYESHGQMIDPRRCEQLVEDKARKYEQIIKNGLPAMPGAVEFIRVTSRNYTLAIASGSLRREIEYLLGKMQLRANFRVLATADDCVRSKPDPEVYLKALAGLAQLPEFQTNPLHPGGCLAIEDAPGGVDAAHAAGLKCLALAHSRPLNSLRHAEWLFKGFNDVRMEEIARAFK